MSNQKIINVYDTDMVDFLCRDLPVPSYVDRQRLYNVAFDLQTHAVKLYFLDEAGTSLIKIGVDGTYCQSLAEPGSFDAKALFRRLGYSFDLNEIMPDTVESKRLYLYLEPAKVHNYVRFLQAFATCHGLLPEQLLARINAINGQRVTGFCDAHKKNAVSLVRIDLDSAEAGKLYARPWRYQQDFLLDEVARDFFCRLYACSAVELEKRLQYAWVSIDIKSGRQVVASQNHALLH